MIIKLLYKHSSGEVIQALEEWDWMAKGCPMPVIDATPEEWNSVQGKRYRVENGSLVVIPEPEKQLGQLTLGYITKLNTAYPNMNLLATDTIEEARGKLETAGVGYTEVSTLITFYDKGW